jgi:hypothetical protein
VPMSLIDTDQTVDGGGMHAVALCGGVVESWRLKVTARIPKFIPYEFAYITIRRDESKLLVLLC